MPVRRSADPISAQRVWDAIRFAHAQRQMADSTRILKYLQRVDNCSYSQAELYLKQSLDDGLVIVLQKTVAKGSKTGEPVESFKIPVMEMPTPKRDGKDWYCIDCHLAGDVVACKECHRVFHPECGYKKQQEFKTPIKLNNLNNSEMEDRQIRSPSPRDSSSVKGDLSLMDTDDVINISDDLNSSCELADPTKQESGKSSNESVAPNDDGLKDTAPESLSTELPANGKEEDVSSLKGDENLVATKKDLNEYDETLCSVCNMCKIEPDLLIEKDELNYLLSFVHNRIKSWLPITITDTLSSEEKPEWLTETEINWRAQQLFYQPMNMITMEMKLQMEEYTTTSEFKADVMTVLHNIALYHGIESQEFGAAEYMKKDCDYDILELLNCVDCYKHSNEKVNDKWFCLPCRIPHMLVWAKQKGYPYWPAKVIKVAEDTYDVRFFGGKYERSVLSSTQIKPITNIPREGKKTTALVRAIEELKTHQKLLDSPNELKKFLAASKRKKTQSKPKTLLGSKMQKSATKQRTKSIDLSLKGVYDFTESPVSADNESNITPKPSKRKRSASPMTKAKSTRTSEYPTRRALQNQYQNKTGAAKNGTPKQNVAVDTLNSSLDLDDPDVFSIREEDYEFGKGYDASHEEVSSSTERVTMNEGYSRDNSDGLMPQPERQYSEAVEKLRRKLEQCRNKSELIAAALDGMQTEIDRTKNEHDEYLKKVFDAHNAQISETKKKQWCYNCEQDAIYHCCWNTAYCSLMCQQNHWQAEHKKVCRRKR